MKFLLSLVMVLSFSFNAHGASACGNVLQGLKDQAEREVAGILSKNPECKDAFYKGSSAKASVAACPSEVWAKIDKKLRAKAGLFDEACMSDACVDSDNCMEIVDDVAKKGFNGINVQNVRFNLPPAQQTITDIPVIEI